MFVSSYDCAAGAEVDRSYLSMQYILLSYNGIDFFTDYVGEVSDKYDSFRVASFDENIFIIGYELNDMGDATSIRAITMNNGILFEFIYSSGENRKFEHVDELFHSMENVIFPTEEYGLSKYEY